ncbi:PREDICTED: uncharacterized protein LOC108758819 [Trachymyrmex cornetzi]|uniref:Uncharacterized protein n=1 Tax=Trachymyrmex cornetzi TaxID=471704 RepID=A0A195ECB6_9HYME|nr:PREDICTED: uncharacterized protein LOC108758819 [Trachymyrmex cornetzi]KYN22865.1 hypothetical protein ALC57_04648 [Trachymyrmex cornetzi]
MDTYAKTRLTKIYGEKFREFPRDLKAHGDQNKNNLNPHYNKLDGNQKLQADAVSNKTETKLFNKDIGTKVKRDIIAENITKQGKRLPVRSIKRISATSNFIYEFNPFVNTEQSRPLTSHTILWRKNNSAQTLPHSKTDFVKRRSSAVLPELKSHIDSVTNDPDLNVTNSSPTKNTCLPILGRENPTRILNKQVDKEFEQDDINREVEKVKSAWQVLRGEKDWTKGKDRVDNVQTKKLYEMLEKMTCEIDRVQRSYMDPKANRYLHKSANNVLKTSKPSLQEEAEIMRNLIFPDRKARTKSAFSILRNEDSKTIGKDMARIRFDEGVENILTDKQLNKNFLSSNYTAKKQSINTEAQEYDIPDDIRSIHTIASNKKQDTAIADMMKPKFTDESRIRAKIRSSIEEYLQHHTDNIHKSYGIEEKKEEYSQSVKPPSVSDIENILTSHNIGSHMLYENFERHSDDHDSENYASEDDAYRFYSNTATNATQVTSVDTTQENRRIQDMSLENTGLYNDIRPTKAVDAKSSNIRRHSSATNFQDNAFLKMGLNENLSRDTLSQILQSEYLRKDLSL